MRIVHLRSPIVMGRLCGLRDPSFSIHGLAVAALNECERTQKPVRLFRLRLRVGGGCRVRVHQKDFRKVT